MLAQMLAPAAVLIAWSMVMLFWMAITRFSGMAKLGTSITAAQPGGRGKDLDGVLPDKVNWKAHNYNHLMEQPTIFYAAVVVIALMGGSALDVTIAWIYVALRIVHSIYQATINKVHVRFGIFFVSNFMMLYLAYRAVMLTVFADPGVAP